MMGKSRERLELHDPCKAQGQLVLARGSLIRHAGGLGVQSTRELEYYEIYASVMPNHR